ncbi:MAG: 2TM domain-containing protein [Leptolyngbyaceae cyanobacterium SM1_3_5]|nr:2TM domain-containing protein [Leptolyngbyaceae cyanobacterium SM1_3_5]
MPDTYRQEDAQQILHIAIARQVESGELTRVQLFEIADELGISAADLELAEAQWQSQHGERQERQAFDRYRRSKLGQSFGRFAIVNGFFMLLNGMGGELSWSLYVAAAWGMLLSLEAWKTYQTAGEAYETAFSHWYQKRRIRRKFSSLFDRLLKA